MRSKKMEEVWTTSEYLMIGEEVTPVKGRAEILLLYKTGSGVYLGTNMPNLPYRRVLTREEAVAEFNLGKQVYRKERG